MYFNRNEPEHDLVNLQGQIFDKLTVLVPHHGMHVGERTMWFCKCDCGNHVTAFGDHITEGRVKSCNRCELDVKEGDTKHVVSHNQRDIHRKLDDKMKHHDAARAKYWPSALVDIGG